MLDADDPARGARILDLRRSRPMTQEALATAAGVSVQTIRRAEAGRPLSVDTAQALCAVFGLTTTQLAGTGTTGVTPSTVPHLPSGRGISRPRRSTMVILALLALGMVLQVSGWASPGPDEADYFCVYQALSQMALAVAGAVLVVRRGWRNGTAWPRVVRMATVVAALLLVCLPPRQLWASQTATVNDVLDDMFAFQKADVVVRLRHVLEPGWDETLARWDVMRIYSTSQGWTSSHLDSPGALAAYDAGFAKCREMYLHAPTYPRNDCEWEGHRLSRGRWSDLVATTFGLSLTRRTSPREDFDDLIADPAYAEARGVYERNLVTIPNQRHRPMAWKPAFDEAVGIASARQADAHR